MPQGRRKASASQGGEPASGIVRVRSAENECKDQQRGEVGRDTGSAGTPAFESHAAENDIRDQQKNLDGELSVHEGVLVNDAHQQQCRGQQDRVDDIAQVSSRRSHGQLLPSEGRQRAAREKSAPLASTVAMCIHRIWR
mgnify:CR=1 FL=1